MIKRYSIQLLGEIPSSLVSSLWVEKFQVHLISSSFSENIILIECEETNLPNFLKNLSFAKLQ